MKDTLLLIAFLLIFLCGIFIGQRTKQEEIENRAKKIEKECYTETDLEIIIFNKSQL